MNGSHCVYTWTTTRHPPCPEVVDAVVAPPCDLFETRERPPTSAAAKGALDAARSAVWPPSRR